MTARQPTARFKVTGLNAAPRYPGEVIATTTVATTANARQRSGGQVRCQKIRRAAANSTSASPSPTITGLVSAVARPASWSIATVRRGAEELRHDPVVRKDRGETDPRDTVCDRLPHDSAGIGAVLQPQAQAIEAPGGRPAHQRPKHHAIEDGAERSVPRRVVIRRQEPDARARRDVLPEPATLADQAPGLVRTEPEHRGVALVRQLPLADAPPFAGDNDPKPEARFVAKALRGRRVGPWEVVDLREARQLG